MLNYAQKSVKLRGYFHHKNLWEYYLRSWATSHQVICKTNLCMISNMIFLLSCTFTFIRQVECYQVGGTNNKMVELTFVIYLYVLFYSYIFWLNLYSFLQYVCLFFFISFTPSFWLFHPRHFQLRSGLHKKTGLKT